MRTISGSQKPLSGRVLLEGTVIHELPARQLAKKLSLVLTERVQAGLLTAYEVVALGRYPHTDWTGKLNDKDHEIIHWSIEMAGAQELAGRVLAELSDGERQKVMVARALAQEPELMILDEVTAFLDLPRRVEIMQLLRNLAHTTGKAILLSTHDMDLALRSADRLWLLPKGGELQVGAPEDLVLNGSFEQAFAGEGVAFDRSSGAFQMNQNYQQAVQLAGEGEIVLWTKRALEREGVAIAEQAPVRIEIQDRTGQARWLLHHKTHSNEFDSIYQLLVAMRKEVWNN
jgi:iron complex transport system ATP-binding protein